MLLICPECNEECTIDEGSTETVSCPGCGMLLYSNSIRSATHETRIAPAAASPEEIAQTGAWQPAVQDYSPTPDQLPLVQGRYKLTELLGEGGFAHVYRAFDSKLGREVALKIPRKDRFNSRESMSQFLDEARISAGLEHHGIIRVYDVDWLSSDICYISMEFCSGGSLDQLLKKGDGVTRQRAVGIVADIAEAIHFAHLKGFVHRDLKPSNIMFGSDGRARIVDFGLAMPDELQLDHPGEVAGTLPYMSPEQVRGESHLLDGRSDIWSLGVLLYLMLTGRRPFLGDKRQLVEQILKREPKPPRQVIEDVPPELEQICLRCLSKAVSARWETARDVADQLRSWLNSASDNTASVSLTQLPNRSPWWRTETGRGVIAAGLLSGVSLLAFNVISGRRSENEKRAVVASEPGPNDWNMDESKPHRRYQLLLRAPQKLAWPVSDVATSFDHEPGEAKLSISSRSLTLIELGETQAADFRLETEIYKSALTGKSGIFWGYQTDPDNKDRSSCYAVSLQCFADKKNQTTISIVFSCLTFQRLPNGEIQLTVRQDLASDKITALKEQGDQLVVQVRSSGLHDIQWNGQTLKAAKEQFASALSAAQPPITPYRSAGRFGLLNEFGSTLTRNASFTLLQGTQR